MMAQISHCFSFSGELKATSGSYGTIEFIENIIIRPYPTSDGSEYELSHRQIIANLP